jgi:hypothetical protein
MLPRTAGETPALPGRLPNEGSGKGLKQTVRNALQPVFLALIEIAVTLLPSMSMIVRFSAPSSELTFAADVQRRRRIGH